jgi:hypothetical protein
MNATTELKGEAMARAFTVYLDEKTYQTLRAESFKSGLKMAEIIRLALRSTIAEERTSLKKSLKAQKKG